MEKFTLSVSTDTYLTKPTKTEYKNMVFHRRNLNTRDLHDLIKNGHSFCNVFNKGVFNIKYKSHENFAFASLIVYDIDHSPLSYDYVIDKILIKPTIIYETIRSSVEDVRFRMMYLLEAPITSSEEYRIISETFLNSLFENDDLKTIQPFVDTCSYSSIHLYLGTNEKQRIEINDTIIPFDYITSLTEAQPFHPFDLSSIEQFCPKSDDYIQLNYPPYDLNLNTTFGTEVNNTIFPVNPYNNFYSAVIDVDIDKSVYFYVGNQNIYSLSTYLKNGKVEIGKRHSTMKYHMIVLHNMHPEITISDMFKRVRWLINSYYINPWEITDEDIYRMSRSILKFKKRNDTGRRKFILNPKFNHYTKSQKIKEFQKSRSEHTKLNILSSIDLNKTIKENAENLGYSVSTTRKYLKSEGIDLKEMRFNQFKEVYLSPDNRGKKDSEFIALTGICKSQVYRYISKIKEVLV